MDKEVSKIWANVCAAAATVGVWISISFVCIWLRGPVEPPMVAGTITTVIIWALRKIE